MVVLLVVVVGDSGGLWWWSAVARWWFSGMEVVALCWVAVVEAVARWWLAAVVVGGGGGGGDGGGGGCGGGARWWLAATVARWWLVVVEVVARWWRRWRGGGGGGGGGDGGGRNEELGVRFPQVVIMDSSNASNSNKSNTTCGSILPQSSSLTQTRDPAWKWATCKDPAFPKKLSCTLCNKEMCGGGITRLKQHITQVKGNVSSCMKATVETINEIRQNDSIKKLKKAHRDNVDAMYRRTQYDEKSDADTDDEDHEVQEVEKDSNVGSSSQVVVQSQSKRKFKSQSSSRGPMDLLMQRDHQKTQQATLDRNCSAKEKLKKDAWKSISAWMTENSISFNTVRCPSFQQMIYAIVKVVRLVDIERKPTMPSFYDIMRIARNQLEEKFSEDDDTWGVIKACFEKRWKNNFNHALHCAAYYLNPSIFYTIEAYEMDSDPKYIKIKRGLHIAMQRLIPNEDELDDATGELRKYADAVGILGTPPCKRKRNKDQPLALEKTKSHNATLNDSVFIQYNKKLQRRYLEIQQYNDNDKANDPIFLEERDENDEWLELRNLNDLEVHGDYVTFDDLQEIVSEERGTVGSKGASSSRSKSTYPTNSEYDGYDTDDLMLDTQNGLLGGVGNDGVTLDDDIYDESNYID
ncbi:hypothetical protein C5167_018492 [Papaver somniferum]|uniref:BED-type domain-containing protein n=1 Tax=Papaver somniferum TaxID=3469 RepID=A0A4Y7IME6_PAPSO|nr:hypothetical protein C5167_018492 [Papaver somniferum]